MLDKVVELAEHLQKETGKKVLWGTAQLFKHPRFMHGAATSAHSLGKRPASPFHCVIIYYYLLFGNFVPYIGSQMS